MKHHLKLQDNEFSFVNSVIADESTAKSTGLHVYGQIWGTNSTLNLGSTPATVSSVPSRVKPTILKSRMMKQEEDLGHDDDKRDAHVGQKRAKVENREMKMKDIYSQSATGNGESKHWTTQMFPKKIPLLISEKVECPTEDNTSDCQGIFCSHQNLIRIGCHLAKSEPQALSRNILLVCSSSAMTKPPPSLNN